MLLHSWVNREDVDFAAAERMPSVQEWELQPENVGGVLEYPTQVIMQFEELAEEQYASVTTPGMYTAPV